MIARRAAVLAAIAFVALVGSLELPHARAQTPSAAPAPVPTLSAVITISTPRAPLVLEVANTFAQREYGLMYRTSVPHATGMIFVFAVEGEQDFWMKNTLVPLDMVFVAANGAITSIASNVPASTLTTPDAKVAHRAGRSRYVIELRAGDAERLGLREHQKLRLPELSVGD